MQSRAELTSGLGSGDLLGEQESSCFQYFDN